MRWIRAIKSILFFISAAVGLSLLMGLWSVYINPARWIVPSLFGMIYPYLFALNAALLVFASLYSRRFVVVHLLLLIIGLPLFNRFCLLYRVDDSSAPELYTSNSIKVMSFNVRGFNRYKWLDDPKIQEKIERLIKNSDPDVVCFQEFHTPGKNKTERIERLAARLELPFYIGQNDGYRKSLNGLAIFSRYPIRRIRAENFQQRQGGNGYVVADVKCKGSTIRVVNMHLESLRFEQPEYDYAENPGLEKEKLQTGGLGILKRFVRAAKLRGFQSEELVEIANQSDYPVILAGDANDYPVSFAYQTLTQSYKDAFVSNGRGIGNTYAGKLPFLRIDYLMCSEGLMASSYETWRKEKLSDHYPILATFNW
ncbi:MAG TPA: endonuclease/exonuclease/phosphatase family protein [Luteibaculaceae bacterium]|nr:endonuclease/exonuclease/phosphatase family protein [Luteibaculaceae bacterium]